MSDKTKIEWTDATWSPVTGCTKVSDGCLHCYIERTPPFRMEHRKFDRPGIGGTTGVRLHEGRLHQPVSWRKPRRIFVCSMADLFHDDVPTRFIAMVWATMARAPQHTFQVLTKRPGRMRALIGDGGQALLEATGPEDEAIAQAIYDAPWPLPNVWLGVSAEDQQWADIRIPTLLETPAAVRWVSAEPLLNRLDISPWADSLSWLVAGGESGPSARPMHPRWARLLRDQCGAAGIPFLFKQWGEWAPVYWKGEGGATHAFTGGFYREAGMDVEGFMELGHSPTSSERDERAPHGAQGMYRAGRKAAGRLLDGREWNEYPEVSE